MQELEENLRNDISRIGLNVDFKLNIRGYSKTYFGRYDPNINTVILYVFVNKKGDLYPYLDILLTAIHEVIHCKQWSDPKFRRIKGVMHDVEFKQMYNEYSDRAKSLNLLKSLRS